MTQILSEREYKGPAITLEEQSLSGSTVGLLRSESMHSNRTTTSMIPPPVGVDDDQFQSRHPPPAVAVPMSRSDQDGDNAPVMTYDAPILISLPQQHSIPGPGAAGDSVFVMDDETDVLPRKRPRPLVKLDQFPSIPDPEIWMWFCFPYFFQPEILLWLSLFRYLKCKQLHRWACMNKTFWVPNCWCFITT